jgi:hypothetical protein
MSGRGKGGKVCFFFFFYLFALVADLVLQGLGKGGAKRHRKILRDNIQGEPAWGISLQVQPLMVCLQVSQNLQFVVSLVEVV